jgi:capsular polysaccharide biosynthesis protein
MRPPQLAPRVRDYGRLLVASWLVIVCASVLSAAAGLWVCARLAPTYTATAQLFATIPGDASTRTAYNGEQNALTRMDSYQRLATSAQVLGRTIQGLSLPVTPAELAGAVSATIEPGSVLLRISVSGPDGDTARDTANLLARNLIEVTRNLDTSGGTVTAELVLIDSATTSTRAQPAWAEYLVLGAALGAFTSSVLMLARGSRRAAVLDIDELDYVTGDLDRAGTAVR